MTTLLRVEAYLRRPLPFIQVSDQKLPEKAATMTFDESAIRTEIDEIITGITFSDDHDELVDALIKIVRRERSLGQANLVRNLQASLPEAVREGQYKAWREGFEAQGEMSFDTDGQPMMQVTNPYEVSDRKDED